MIGDNKNDGKVAFTYGPLVLAADEALMGDVKLADFALQLIDGFNTKTRSKNSFAIWRATERTRNSHDSYISTGSSQLTLTLAVLINGEPAPEKFKTWPGAKFSIFKQTPPKKISASFPSPTPA